MKVEKNRPCQLYMVTNKKNGKRYIGVTTRSLRKRLNEHFAASRNNVNQGRFYRAIRKHGKEPFFASHLKWCLTIPEALAEEIRLIAELKPEYNSTAGGDGQLKRPITEEGRRRISEANKHNKYHFGKSHTEETRRFLRELNFTEEAVSRWNAYRGLGPQASSKKVLCKEDGLIFESASAAARHYGLANNTVSMVCAKKKYRHTAGGRHFEYVSH